MCLEQRYLLKMDQDQATSVPLTYQGQENVLKTPDFNHDYQKTFCIFVTGQIILKDI